MFVLYANKNRLTLRQRETLTSGSVNVFSCRFAFSADWDGLTRTAVFQGSGRTVSVVLDAGGVCAIPWEVLDRPGGSLFAGVCGRRGEETVLPTVWSNLGVIQPGAEPGTSARPPTPELWQQELERKGDRLGYTSSGELGLYAGDTLLSAVPVGVGGPPELLPTAMTAEELWEILQQ